MKKLFICLFIFPVSMQASETFITTLTEKWQQQDVSELINYLDTQITQQSQDPQILFARANVAAQMEQWIRGGTNYLHQARESLALSAEYSASNKAILLTDMDEHIRFFELSITTFNEPDPSYPQTNITVQAELFQASPNKFPYSYFLKKLDELKE
jgi:hypothetical protein